MSHLQCGGRLPRPLRGRPGGGQGGRGGRRQCGAGEPPAGRGQDRGGGELPHPPRDGRQVRGVPQIQRDCCHQCPTSCG